MGAWSGRTFTSDQYSHAGSLRAKSGSGTNTFVSPLSMEKTWFNEPYPPRFFKILEFEKRNSQANHEKNLSYFLVLVESSSVFDTHPWYIVLGTYIILRMRIQQAQYLVIRVYSSLEWSHTCRETVRDYWQKEHWIFS